MPDWHQEEFELRTTGRGSVEITARIQEIVRGSEIERGLAHFVSSSYQRLADFE